MLRVYFTKYVSFLIVLAYMFVPHPANYVHTTLTAVRQVSPSVSSFYQRPVMSVRDTVRHWVPRFYHVRPGDTLSKIATRYYGSSRYWPTLWDHDRRIANPNLIYVGEKLWIPYHPTSRITRRFATVTHVTDVTHSTHVTTHYYGSIQSYVVAEFGSGAGCADEILNHESGLNWSDVTIENPGSGAYGLPQALPGYKMSSAGSDWATNPATQLRWMHSYVDSVYGGVCNAAYHDLSTGTY